MKHNSFYRNMFWQYGLQFLKYLFPLLLVPYLTRVLSAEGYAVYAYVLSFLGVMQTIADFGFTLSGTKKVVQVGHEKSAVAHLIGDITVARLMLITVLAVVTFCIAQFIPILAENVLYVLLAFVAVALRALLPDFVFQGFEQMGPLTTRYFASKGVMVVLVLLLVHSPEDLIWVAMADIAGAVVGLVWSFVAMRQLFGITIAAPSVRRSFRELYDSAIYCVSNISSSLFSGFTTLIIGLAVTDKTDLAFWSLTLTTVNAVQALYTPITNSLYPHMINNRDFGFAKRLSALALPALIIGTVAYCGLAEPIMLVLGGAEYAGAAHVMRVISPLLIVSFYAVLIGWPILGAMGYVKELTASTVVTGIVNVAALLILYLTGKASLDAICVVRWSVDALLLLLRFFVLKKAFKDRH